jgi:phosphatidylglycerophosphatase A
MKFKFKGEPNVDKIIASCGGLGYIPLMSGTFGSLLGVAFYLLFARFPDFYLLLTIAVCGLSFYIAPRAERAFGQEDDSRIVIDEVAGQMVALLFLPVGWAWAIWGLAIFRFFDIFKPPPIHQIEDRWGGPGVTADDLMAGVYTFVILQIVHLVF